MMALIIVCRLGFYCTGGAIKSTQPVNSTVGGPCPRGYYCPSGSSAPLACPPSTYQPSTGRSVISQCLPCTPGSYCGSFALTAPTGLCSAGYYCKNSSSTSIPLTLSTNSYTGLLSGIMQSTWLLFVFFFFMLF